MKNRRSGKVLRAALVLLFVLALPVMTTGCIDMEGLVSLFGEGLGSGVASELAPEVDEAFANLMKLAEGVIEGGIDVDGQVTFPGAESEETPETETPELGEALLMRGLPNEDGKEF